MKLSSLDRSDTQDEEAALHGELQAERDRDM